MSRLPYILIGFYLAFLTTNALLSSDPWSDWISTQLQGHSDEWFGAVILSYLHLRRQGDATP